METVHETSIPGLKLVARGKVRDIYEADRDHLLLVATDRLSAFDVVMPDPIPGKGAVLTALSNFWFERTQGILPNHMADGRPWATHPDNAAYQTLKGRAVLVHKAEPVLIEAVVRGYLSGSGWGEYQRTGSICGLRLPAGLTESARLPEAVFTPSTKAPQGEHDENVSFETAANRVGVELATRVRDTALRLYTLASAYARERGIIIADTKFEFGIKDGNLIVIDEMLTPDSSRFWPVDGWKPGGPQASFDKQFVRDYLLSINYNKKPPAPTLPAEIIQKTAEKYKDALSRLAPGHEALGWL
ncbi:MAG: phosphoribosylaminoimidazolesuccinocarboxamide synthase [Candidatus Coatesbacteria bacterium]